MNFLAQDPWVGRGGIDVVDVVCRQNLLTDLAQISHDRHGGLEGQAQSSDFTHDVMTIQKEGG